MLPSMSVVEQTIKMNLTLLALLHIFYMCNYMCNYIVVHVVITYLCTESKYLWTMTMTSHGPDVFPLCSFGNYHSNNLFVFFTFSFLFRHGEII